MPYVTLGLFFSVVGRMLFYFKMLHIRTTNGFAPELFNLNTHCSGLPYIIHIALKG